MCHLGVPRIDVTNWSLSVAGLVARPRTLSFADLLAYPKHTVASIHQCAGSPLAPAEPTRRITNVVWGGTRLIDILADAGLSKEATFIWSFGADYGKFADVEVDRYQKDLPIARIDDDILVAYELNGGPLPAENGYPARLVVPGFYGTNSTKWLTEIRAEQSRATGPFTTRWYNDPIAAPDGTACQQTRPVWAVAPESIIVSPAPMAKLPHGTEVEIWGWAWADGGVTAVSVTANGVLLSGVELEAPAGREWQRFSVRWTPDRSGESVLASVAKKADGTMQPPANFRNAVHHVTVRVV
nr:molybdopterin-dependent oxidoreductase [Variibacter gotjawalensis]